MGCDIHMVVEVKHDDTWVGIHSCPYAEAEMYVRGDNLKDKDGKDVTGVTGVTGTIHWPIRGRNYDFFAALAGVRGEGKKGEGKPLGVPDDASALARMEIEGWDADGHSHSWAPAEKFLKLCCKHGQLPDIVRTTIEEGASAGPLPVLADYAWKYLGVSESIELKDIRIVYWFDN